MELMTEKKAQPINTKVGAPIQNRKDAINDEILAYESEDVDFDVMVKRHPKMNQAARCQRSFAIKPYAVLGWTGEEKVSNPGQII